MPEIETARLKLRMFSPTDLDDLAAIFGDPEVMRYMGTVAGVIPSREETEKAINSIVDYWQRHGFGRWAAIYKEHGKLIGYCGLRLLVDTPEVVYLLAREYWGKGLATEAAKACLRYGFEQLQFDQIIGVTRHQNIASRRVMIKIGMRYDGELRYEGNDYVRYAIRREEIQPDDSFYLLN